MKFCDNCGSYMKLTAEGHRCPRCGKTILLESETREMRTVQGEFNGIYVIEKPSDSFAKTSQVCPRCGSEEAYHSVSSISGEHAGTRRERTVDHFKCVKCSYAWSKSS